MEDEDLKKLGALFTELGVKPNLDSAEGLQTWMTEWTHAREVKKEREDVRPKTETSHQMADRIPRLPNFTATSEHKDSTPYEVWRYEVECLLLSELHSRDSIAEAVRRSLKGEAAKVAMRLGVGITTRELIRKFDGLYGTVATEASLLTLFYASQQEESEDVATWSLRLEDIIQKVVSKGLISQGTTNEMLRSKLWTGLADDRLKQATRYKYDTIKNYDDLVVELRRVEQEMSSIHLKGKKSEKKITSQMIQKKTGVDERTSAQEERTKVAPDWKKLEEKLDRIEKDVSELKADRQISDSRGTYARNSRGTYRGNDRGTYRGNSRGRYRGKSRNRFQEARGDMSSEGQDKANGDTIICYRCGGEGHIALGCRVRTDHLRQLKDESPLSGVRQ